jgi:hypothetical protein
MRTTCAGLRMSRLCPISDMIKDDGPWPTLASRTEVSKEPLTIGTKAYSSYPLLLLIVRFLPFSFPAGPAGDGCFERTMDFATRSKWQLARPSR